jgi:hypothetical protein
MFGALSAEDPERIRLYLARHQGDLVAATILVRVGAHAWYPYGASSTDKREVRRCLTDAGRVLGDPALSVDLIEQDDGVLARCIACSDSEWQVSFDPAGTGGRATGWATREAGQWARRHAETCRTMRPPAGQGISPALWSSDTGVTDVDDGRWSGSAQPGGSGLQLEY